MTIRRTTGRATLVAAIGASVLLTGCGNSDSGGGGILRMGTLSTLDSLNPFVAIQDLSGDIQAQIYPRLVQFVPSGRVIGDLASSWTTADGGTVFTFHLHEGKWSDGKPLTAEDVVWTFQTVAKFQNGPTNNSAAAVANFVSAQATDPETVTLRFSKPNGQIYAALAAFDILPRHIWQRYATGDGTAIKRFANAAPVVSGGPFSVEKFQKGSQLLLQRNPGYYGQKPKVERIGLQFYSNADALVSALEHHELDAAQGIPVASVKKLSSAGLTVEHQPGISQLMLSINSKTSRTTHAELRNPLVRQAFDTVIDRSQIVQTAYLGYAQPGGAMVPPALSAYHAPIAPTQVDLARANALLDQAGYARGSNGIRVADGHPMSYQVIEISNPGGGEAPTFEILQPAFRQLGVQLNLKVLDGSAALPLIFGNHNDYDGTDMVLISVTGNMDAANILSYTTCSAIGIYNVPGWCDNQYQSLYEQQSTTTDVATRRQLILQMQQIIDQAKPYLVLAYPEQLSAHDPAWSGFVDSATGWFLNKQTAVDVRKG